MNGNSAVTGQSSEPRWLLPEYWRPRSIALTLGCSLRMKNLPLCQDAAEAAFALLSPMWDERADMPDVTTLPHVEQYTAQWVKRRFSEAQASYRSARAYWLMINWVLQGLERIAVRRRPGKKWPGRIREYGMILAALNNAPPTLRRAICELEAAACRVSRDWLCRIPAATTVVGPEICVSHRVGVFSGSGQRPVCLARLHIEGISEADYGYGGFRVAQIHGIPAESRRKEWWTWCPPQFDTPTVPFWPMAGSPQDDCSHIHAIHHENNRVNWTACIESPKVANKLRVNQSKVITGLFSTEAHGTLETYTLLSSRRWTINWDEASIPLL